MGRKLGVSRFRAMEQTVDVTTPENWCGALVMLSRSAISKRVELFLRLAVNSGARLRGIGCFVCRVRRGTGDCFALVLQTRPQCNVEKSLLSSLGDDEQGYVRWKPSLLGEHHQQSRAKGFFIRAI